MSERLAFVAATEDAGKRVDVAVAERLDGVSRSAAQELVREGHVRVNGRSVRPSHRLAAGQLIEAESHPKPALSAQPEDIPLTIVYRDADVAVLDKPAGLVVHPAPGHVGGTVANALAALFPQTTQVGAPERPGIVHRLDKDTSGLMVVALTPAAHRSLQAQIAARTASRKYLALAAGLVTPGEGVIDAPIGRDPRDRKRMWVHGVAARQARTFYRVLEPLEHLTYLEASLQTGRTHQIRVHFAAMGHPLAGDRLYGGPALPGLERQFLHAWSLSFRSPSTGLDLKFTSALPPDLESALRRARCPT